MLVYGAGAEWSRIFFPLAGIWPNLVGAAVGSVTSDFRSRPKKWRHRNTGSVGLKKIIWSLKLGSESLYGIVNCELWILPFCIQKHNNWIRVISHDLPIKFWEEKNLK